MTASVVLETTEVPKEVKTLWDTDEDQQYHVSFDNVTVLMKILFFAQISP